MKKITIALLCLLKLAAYSQHYPFETAFTRGTIIFRDSTQKNGLLKWFPSQDEKLKFKDSEKGDTKKYTPDDIFGFRCDTLKFVSLHNIEVYAAQFAILGKPLKIRHIFGQIIDSGRFNIYLVFVTDYNPIAQSIQTFPNYIFEKKYDSATQYAAYPVAVRMRDKKFEKAKEPLFGFFREYPEIVNKLKDYKKEDDFETVISLMRRQN